MVMESDNSPLPSPTHDYLIHYLHVARRTEKIAGEWVT